MGTLFRDKVMVPTVILSGPACPNAGSDAQASAIAALMMSKANCPIVPPTRPSASLLRVTDKESECQRDRRRVDGQRYMNPRSAYQFCRLARSSMTIFKQLVLSLPALILALVCPAWVLAQQGNSVEAVI